MADLFLLGVGIVLGYAAGLCQLVKSGHKCHHDDCHAMVGEAHDYCAGHHDLR